MNYSITPEIVRILKNELAEKKFPIGSRFPSAYELADRFGVTRGTASRAVDALVSAGLLERLVRGGGTRVLQEEPFPKGQIAFIGTVKASYSSIVLKGAVDGALLQKYVVSLLNPPPQYLQHYLDGFKTMPFQGILTMAYGPIQAPEGIPVIHVNQEFPDTDTVHHAVSSDNYGGACRMMKAILAAGHRDIAFFLTQLIGWNGWNGEDYQRAYKDILREAGISDWKERFFFGHDGEPKSAEYVLPQIFEKFPNVTAIVTENDNDAIFVMAELLRCFPERMGKIAVTGFGGLPYLSNRLEFASVDQQLEKMGQVAAEKLIRMIEEGPPEKPLRVKVETKLLNLECLRRFHC